MLKQKRRVAGRGSCALLLPLLLYCGACTQRLYEGAELPRNQVAVLDATGVQLWSIDDQRLYTHSLGYMRYTLTPGSHTVVVRYQTPEEPSALRNAPKRAAPHECTLILQAEAGATYRLRSRGIGLDTAPQRWDGSWEAWVDRGDEGEQVAHCVAEPERGDSRQAARATAARVPAPTPQSAPAPAPAQHSPEAGQGGAIALPAAAPTAAAKVAAATPTPFTRPEIRLGTWNLRGLGLGRGHDVSLIATIIEAHFDVVALTEVHSTAAVADSPLAAALGDAWLWLADPSDAATKRERYLVAYRRDALRPCPGWEEARVYTPDAAPTFLRPPAIVCLQTPATDTPAAFDFLLAAYRADWGDGDQSVVAAEVAQLDAVLTAMLGEQPGERDLFIAGDFNLDPDDVRPLVKAALVTRGGGSTLDLHGERGTHIYDQVVLLDARASGEMLGLAEVEDVREQAGGATRYLALVSDHLPVILRLRALGPDDD